MPQSSSALSAHMSTSREATGEGSGSGGATAFTPLARVSTETRSIASFIVWGLLSILSAHQGGLA